MSDEYCRPVKQTVREKDVMDPLVLERALQAINEANGADEG